MGTPLNPTPESDEQAEPGFFLGRYRKAVTAFAGAGLAWGAVVVESEPAAITSGEWISLGLAMLGVLGVAAVPNKA